jgi:hypothetical protein
MELHSFLTFMGGVLVGMGVGMLLLALVITIWMRDGDSRG